MSALTDIFDSIADAIRAKNGSSDTYTPAQMPTAIENIPSGGGTETTLWENSKPTNNYGTRNNTTQINLSETYKNYSKLKIYYKRYKSDNVDNVSSVTVDISNINDYLVPNGSKSSSYFAIELCATLKSVNSVNFMTRAMYLPAWDTNYTAIVCNACYRLDYYDSTTDYCDYCIPTKICGIK